ncbi:hypothetical protein GCM10020258_36720 [Sphingomonas yabuuchiae]
MIDLYDLGDGRRLQREVTLERCTAKIEALQAQKRDIDAAIAELTEFVALVESHRD